MANKSTLKQNRARQRQKELEEQQAQQIRARVDQMLVNTTSMIFAGMVAKEWDGQESDIPRDVLFKIANVAKIATNVWGESLGLLVPPQPAEDKEETKTLEISPSNSASESSIPSNSVAEND